MTPLGTLSLEIATISRLSRSAVRKVATWPSGRDHDADPDNSAVRFDLSPIHQEIMSISGPSAARLRARR